MGMDVYFYKDGTYCVKDNEEKKRVLITKKKAPEGIRELLHIQLGDPYQKVRIRLRAPYPRIREKVSEWATKESPKFKIPMQYRWCRTLDLVLFKKRNQKH